MVEIFKTISEYPDYEVSNCGRVKTKARRVRYVHAVTRAEHFRQTEETFLKTYYNKQGYRFVQLYKDGKSKNLTIHRLVATVFLTPPSSYDMVVNHKDGNKLNNTVDNLEWCTNEYNHQHATQNGLKAKGSSIGTSKLNEQSVHAIKWFLHKGVGHQELAIAFMVSRPTINMIANKKLWKQVALTMKELATKSN